MQHRIVEESTKLFMKYGIRSISMDEIAHHLSISKKTIYQYYKDKDALVDEVIENEILRHKQSGCEHKICCNNAIHEIFMAMETVNEIFKTTNPIIVFDLKKYHLSAYKKLSDFKSNFFYELIKDNLERGINEGLYRPEINVDIISRYRVGAIFMILDNESLVANKHTITEIMWEIAELFMHGIASNKGIKLIQKYKQQRLK
ncbi:MAG: TetR/AcrR family transcriptional regulator [Chitinophagaceae bacterium]|nr:TetR/AcrR family transcriptional regulator [Chitinophagaceae bacterium]MCW5904964.1 TetR/AcrR family transcriptional regulator [Chitinophagaceae bacterium]